MHSSTAYFAGAGTVVVAVVAGLGGGLLFANMISAKAPKQGTEQTRLEKRMSSEPIQVSNAPTEPVPYLATPQPSATGAVAAVVPAQAQPPQAPLQTEITSSTSAAPVQATDNSVSTQKVDTSVATQKEVPTTAAAAKPAARESAATTDDAMAKARDGDLKRGIERRKAERRQQWTERRHRQPRQELGQDPELREVEEKPREETEPRREFVIGDPVRVEMPRIRLFGPE